ncbi:MAG: NAD(P)-dependent oxidoreductase [Chloroflexota bacterium]
MDTLTFPDGFTVLTTGGTGFSGQRFLLQGVERGVTLHNISTSATAIDGVTQHQVDLRNGDTVEAIVQQVNPDAIVHLAAGGVKYGTGSLRDLIQVNVLGLEALFSGAARLVTPPLFAIAGSWFEYADQTSPLHENDPLGASIPYTLTKTMAAQVAAYYSQTFPVALLRVFSLYGVGEKPPRLFPYIIEQAKAGEPVELTPGEQIRDYVYVDDAAEGFWRLLAHMQDSEPDLLTMNMGTGKGHSLRELVLVLSEQLTRRGLTPDVRFGVKPYRPNETMYAVADVGKLERTLGWLPSTPLADGMNRMIDSLL